MARRGVWGCEMDVDMGGPGGRGKGCVVVLVCVSGARETGGYRSEREVGRRTGARAEVSGAEVLRHGECEAWLSWVECWVSGMLGCISFVVETRWRA
jgi:hypothetical protein